MADRSPLLVTEQEAAELRRLLARAGRGVRGSGITRVFNSAGGLLIHTPGSSARARVPKLNVGFWGEVLSEDAEAEYTVRRKKPLPISSGGGSAEPLQNALDGVGDPIILSPVYHVNQVSGIAPDTIVWVTPNGVGNDGSPQWVMSHEAGATWPTAMEVLEFDEYNNPQDYVIPSNTVLMLLVGGGGGGGGRSTGGTTIISGQLVFGKGAGGGGGGGGGMLLLVTGRAGETVSVTIGEGGAAGASEGSNGDAGGSTAVETADPDDMSAFAGGAAGGSGASAHHPGLGQGGGGPAMGGANNWGVPFFGFRGEIGGMGDAGRTLGGSSSLDGARGGRGGGSGGFGSFASFTAANSGYGAGGNGQGSSGNANDGRDGAVYVIY